VNFTNLDSIKSLYFKHKPAPTNNAAKQMRAVVQKKLIMQQTIKNEELRLIK